MYSEVRHDRFVSFVCVALQLLVSAYEESTFVTRELFKSRKVIQKKKRVFKLFLGKNNAY